MTSGYAGFTSLFAVSIISLAYLGRKIIVKQGSLSDFGTEKQEEVAERKPVEEEAGPPEKQEEVADRKPVEDQEAGPSTATPEKGCFDFDVFISFRGKDTRNGFTSHLHKELKSHGITTFIDSDDLEEGEKISVLFERIEGSKIFLPIFSKNYADSKWCLKEITKMVEIYKSEPRRRPIIPIFYHVVPSDVRHCKDSFGKALENRPQYKQLGGEEINNWKAALTEAGNICGYDLSEDKRTTEAELITCIRERVSDILCNVPFDIQPIGRDSCIKNLKQMLEKEKYGVRMIGICGMGGIGKTTLAMALYNEFFPTFKGCCFLSDIRENGEKKEGLLSLQKRLIESILKESMRIVNVRQGVNLIKERLGRKKVLLVLDDVNDKDHLKALTGDRGKKEGCFGAGSKIIVTTRDKKVLLQHGLQECDIYFPKGLNTKDSLKLFHKHAFDEGPQSEELAGPSREVVDVAQGLPLALKEFGSLFHGLEEKQEWEEELKKLKSEQPKKVHDALKISYVGLEVYEKSVFLDIACFFIGTMKEYPVYMWEDPEYSLNSALKALQDKSLIKINENDEFEMHDQIRDMGRMIVKEEGSFDTLKYSRPWSKSQVWGVLMDAKVRQNDYVQGVDFTKVGNEEIMMSWDVILNMPGLRMIAGANGHHRFEGIISLPRNLRWLDWKCCPRQTLTIHNDWQYNNLCVLDLRNGNFEDFGLCSKAFPNLKVLDLSWCSCLIRTPDFTHFPSLQKLVLDECCSLTEMNESIEQLQKLVELSMVGCEKLTELPIGLCKLAKLESLVLSGCKQISVLPTQIGNLSSLRFLGLSGTSISAVPESLQSLKMLDLTGCLSLEKAPDSICGLESLSYLSHCELRERLLDCYKIFKKGRIEEKSLIYVRLK